jgi:Rrf2 family protein
MFSKACQYAIRAVLFLASETSHGQRIGVKEIAEALEVPGPFLAKLLQQLTRNGLISSVKGPHGGFFLSEADRSRSLKEVAECIDGPQVFSTCILGLPICSSENPCPLHKEALAYRQGLLQIVGHNSIGEIALQIRQRDLKH